MRSTSTLSPLAELLSLAIAAEVVQLDSPVPPTADLDLDEAIDPIVSQIAHLDSIACECDRSTIGKKLPGALYVHIEALSALHIRLRLYEACARHLAGNLDRVTLVKFATDRPKISYLFYPNFDTDPHPALSSSIHVDMRSRQVSHRDYRTTENPPILHRKETFVTPDYPHYERFFHLTRQEEQLGLLADSRSIGTLTGWLQRLDHVGVTIEDHHLACPRDRLPKIERHRAALVRHDLSRPVRCALETGLFTSGWTFFDYGCGHGGDIKRIKDKGYCSSGWDPYYRPDTERVPADIVNLGYVINVIEDAAERREALVNAWELTRQVLLVSAQVSVSDRHQQLLAYGDGFITRRRTFQKYYEQEELKQYIDSVLEVNAVPAGLGIYFVFRHELAAEAFRVSRWKSTAKTPKVRKACRQFDDYRLMLTPLMTFMTERGRLPIAGELPEAVQAHILTEFGSFRHAFDLVLQATDGREWKAIAEQRRQDLLIYLALSVFRHRLQLKYLSPVVKQDLKALFGSIRTAFDRAEALLLQVGDMPTIAQLCQDSPIGQKTQHSLLVHISALNSLSPLLRVYEGCASRTIGRLEGANVIKLHTTVPKISYLSYPDFDEAPHPVLTTEMQISLRDVYVNYNTYDLDDNPPILHWKEQLVLPDYPLYEKFAKLTQQEENWGLLDRPHAIRKWHGWLQRLDEHCAQVKGYRVCWRKDADPYRVKLLQNARRHRLKS
jgi:DNA phosphorothioation-associated putative methyltransferase